MAYTALLNTDGDYLLATVMFYPSEETMDEVAAMFQTLILTTPLK